MVMTPCLVMVETIPCQVVQVMIILMVIMRRWRPSIKAMIRLTVAMATILFMAVEVMTDLLVAPVMTIWSVMIKH